MTLYEYIFLIILICVFFFVNHHNQSRKLEPLKDCLRSGNIIVVKLWEICNGCMNVDKL